MIGGQDTDAVYVYQVSGLNWFLQQKLEPSDGIFGAFGHSVSLADDFLVVGNPFDADIGGLAGAFYAFERQNGVWIEVQKVFGSDTVAGDQFGFDISTDGQTILVSAIDATIDGNSSVGAAYVFEKIGGVWVETQKLAPAVPDVIDNFGLSLSLSGDALVVGARGDDDIGQEAGAAYVYENFGSGWVETDKLFASDGIGGDSFATSVAIDGDLIVVSSPDTGGVGGAYIFELQGGLWVETDKLVPDDGNAFSNFGIEVEVCEANRTVIVGANSPPLNGSAYLFQDTGNGWDQLDKLSIPLVGWDNSRFGTAVDVDGDLALVGAPDTDEIATDSGSAYAYSVSDTNCPTLSADPSSLSLSAGGTQTMNLRAGPAHGQSLYWLVGTLAGTDPGFFLNPFQVPINIDGYFLLSLVPNPGSPLLANMGLLDPQGKAAAQLVLPPGSDASLIGSIVNHAFVVYSLGPLTISHVSNPVGVTLDG